MLSAKLKVRRASKPLNFESLEPRQLMACDATVTSNWDAYGNDVSHTGYVAGSIGTQMDGKVAWSREAVSRTVVHDGLLYTVRSNRLSAIDLKTGVDLWTREFGVLGLRGGDLSFADGNLYFLGMQKDYNLLYSVNATTGDTNWTHYISMQSPSGFPPVVGNGTVYVQGGYYGGLYGVNQRDGSFKFFVNINDFGSWSPAFYNGRLFTWADNLFAERSPDSGAVLWSIQFDKGQATTGFTNTPVVVAGGLAYVVVSGTIYNDKVVAIDIDRRSIYRTVVDYAPRFSPAVAHGRVYVDSSAGVFQSDARSGVIYPLYEQPSSASRQSISQPLVTDDAILKSSGDKTFIFDRATRKLRYTLPVGGELSLANNTLLVSGDGTLSAFSLCNARPVTLAASLKLEETAGIVEAKVSIGTTLPAALNVQLSSSNPALIQVPPSVVIPAGFSSITFPMNVVNNLSRDGDALVVLTASASGYLSSKLSITINDDESAVISDVSDALQELNLGVNRSGYYAGDLGTYLPETPEWSAVASGSELSISRDRIFGNGFSLDANSGKLLWQNDLVDPGVYVDGESLFATSSSSYGKIIFSIDPESGATRWASESMGTSNKSNTSITDKWLLVGAGGGIYRVSRASGQVDDQPFVSAFRTTIHQGTLLVTEGNSISALNLDDFSTLWTRQLERPLDYEYGELTAHNGRLAVNTQPGLRVYDVKTGRELWRVEEAFLGQPAIDKDSVFAIQFGLVIQFDAATGRKLRVFECGQQLSANQPIITDDAIIVTSDERTFVLDRASGQVKRWYATGGKAYLTQNYIYLYDYKTVKAYVLNTRPTLTLSVPELLREGDGSQQYSGQVSISKSQPADLNVALHSDLRPRLALPEFVTIPAGQTSATFSIAVTDDSFDNIQSKGYLSATTSGFRSSANTIVLRDDEMPIDGRIAGDWAMSGADPARSGYVPGTIGTLPFPDVRWRNQFFTSATSAVTSNGNVFVHAYRFVNQYTIRPFLFAFDSENGRLNWEREIDDGNVLSSLTAADGAIYIAIVLDKELKVLAVDQATGDVRWTYSSRALPESFFLRARNVYPPVDLLVKDGIVLVPLINVGLLALSQETGERLYVSAFDSSKSWSPALMGGNVYIWESQTFRALELRTGNALWKKELSAFRPFQSYPLPVLTDDTAVVINQGHLVNLDLSTHEVRWQIPGIFHSQAVIAGNKVFAAEFDLIRTFDLKTGDALEVYHLPGLRDGAQLKQLNVTDDAVVAQAPGEEVWVFSRRTTELLWRFQSDSFLMNLADDTLYLLGWSKLVAISLRTANSYGSADVNRDDLVTALDALFIINHLNVPAANTTLRLDVNSDGSVTPLDALLVINWLNKLSGATGGEGESVVEFQSDHDELELLAVDWTELSHKNKRLLQL